VRAGQVTEVPLGVPLEARLRLRIEGGKLIAEGEFWGPSGEKCEGVVVDGAALPAPRVRILDADGKVLAQPEGGYCCKFTASIVWPLTAGVAGRLRVVPEIAFGPLPIWSESSPTIDVSQ
jgi:hypothetical protein